LGNILRKVVQAFLISVIKIINSSVLVFNNYLRLSIFCTS